MPLLDVAQSVLAVASAAVPEVERTLLAGGPELAKVCEQVAVYPSLLAAQAAGPTGVNQAALLGSCAAVAVPQVTVAYTQDCYPVVQTEGKSVKVPPAADVTAWTVTYLGRCWAIFDALLEAKYDGTFGPCDVVYVGPTTHTGPIGGTCTMLVPVTVGP